MRLPPGDRHRSHMAAVAREIASVNSCWAAGWRWSDSGSGATRGAVGCLRAGRVGAAAAENSELRMDNEFLGKAAAFFASKNTPTRSASSDRCGEGQLSDQPHVPATQTDRRRYYQWLNRRAAGLSAAQQRLVELTEKIKMFHAASDGTYGARRICTTCVSRRDGVDQDGCEMHAASTDSRDQSTPVASTTTVAGPDPVPVPDLVKRAFDSGRPNVPGSPTLPI